MLRYTARLVIATAAAAVAITGCSTATDTPTPLPTSSAPVLTGIASSDDRTATDRATDAAIQKVRDFYAVRGELDADPASDVAKAATVAGDPVLGGITGDIMLRRSQGVVSSGQIAVLTTQATESEAPADADGQPIPGQAWVYVDVCTDTSTWLSNFPDGRSAKDAAVRFVKSQITVRNSNWPDPNSWRVTSLAPQNVEGCRA